MNENTSVNMQGVAEPAMAVPGQAEAAPELTDTRTDGQEAAETAAEVLQEEAKNDDDAEDVGTQQTADSVQEDSPTDKDPARDYSKDAAYAKIRREADEARREAKKLRAALKTLDFEGDSADDIADRAQAYRTGRPIEEIRAERVERERLEQLEQENRELRGRENERIFRDDMDKIKAAYPDVKAKSVEELGADFVRMRAMGIDTLVAYEAMRSVESRTQKPKPPSTGSAKSAGKTEGGLFTREEVKGMSPSEVRKNFDKIRKSMSNWR